MSGGPHGLPPWIRAVDGGAQVDVHAAPRAAKSTVAGTHGERLKIRLAAPPVDGAANDALVDLIAERTGVASRDVTLVRGASSRRKTVAVAGVDPRRLAAALTPDDG